MLKLVSLVFAGTAAAFSSAASAAVVLCSSGPGIDLTTTPCTAAGNDKLDPVEAAIAAATGVNLNSINLKLYGKSDDDASLFSFSVNADPSKGKTTNWTTKDGTLINFVTVKAANTFKVYQLSGAGANSGSMNTLGILNRGGRQPDISHLSFWTSTVSSVPEPGTWALMMLGLGGVGFSMRRGNVQRRRLRLAF